MPKSVAMPPKKGYPKGHASIGERKTFSGKYVQFWHARWQQRLLMMFEVNVLLI